MRYKWDYPWFDFRCYQRPHYGPVVDTASNKNEYQEYFLEDKGGLRLGLTTLPSKCADCLEIWEPQPPGTLMACPAIALPLPLPQL